MRAPENVGEEIVSLSKDECLFLDEPDDQAEETLFLESLVAEANRLLEGLQAVRCRVIENRSGDPEIRVSLKDSRHPLGAISDDRIQLLANKVRAVREGLLGRV
ncbi:MAG: hypothetical protein H7834_07345 [Magnetococcus sp. YQC-9]